MKNYEVYKDKFKKMFLEDTTVELGCIFARVRGVIGKNCVRSTCEACQLRSLQWLSEDYVEKNKITKVEYDLLSSYKTLTLEESKLKEILVLKEMKEKGYFKNLNFELTLREALETSEIEE